MSSTTSLLRVARDEVVPRIPEFTPYLEANPNLVQRALQQSFAEHGADPAEVTDWDWYKAERHTILNYLIGRKTDLMVEGTGREAQFRDVRPGRWGRRGSLSFTMSVIITQRKGLWTLANTLDNGKDVPPRMFSNLENHYTNIYHAAHSKLGRLPEPIAFGDDLRGALTSPSLLTGAFVPLGVAKEYVEKPEDRLEAAHDFVTLPLGIAALHAFEFAQLGRLIVVPPLKVSRGDKGFRASFENKEGMRALYPRISPLPSARLKCPARPNGHLQRLLHATLNASATYKL